MKKGVYVTSFIGSSNIVFASESNVQGFESTVIFMLSLHTILIAILFILFWFAYKRYFPEIFTPTKTEIQEEKKAYANQYDEHTVQILHRYISYYTRHGYTVSHLRSELLQQGYSQNDIDEAISRYSR